MTCGGARETGRAPPVPLRAMTFQHMPLPRLAATLRALPPSCGPVRLIAVDGHAGSGKSTFAARLAEALGQAPVLHLDDLASHDALFDWTARLREQVIDPLSRGESARYEPYDWNARRFCPRAPWRPRRWSSWRAWARVGVRYGLSWRGCCGWTRRRRCPGNGGGDGTDRRRASSGTAGSVRSARTSPTIPRAPSPRHWYASVLRATRHVRCLPGPNFRRLPSLTVKGRRQRADPSRSAFRQFPRVPQLGLTGGRTGLTF